RHALVAAGAARWAAFARLLADAQRRGLESMSEEEVSDFVARYRELTTDLARLRTASRGGDSDAVYSLSRLVAGGHNLLYQGRRVRPAAVGRYLMATVPAEIRRSWRPILLAALLLFVPAIVGFEATRRSPEAALQLVSRDMIDRAETGVVRHESGEGYLPEETARLRGPLLASAITTNNLQVTFIAFAGGATAGVLTVISLVMNGVAAVGAPMGLWARMGILEQILGFVAPHGVLELTAICIAGGAGFLVASGILIPGARTRREALTAQGRRALHLVAGTTLLLLVAGLIEGYVSPLVWPLAWKGAVSAATAVVMIAWLVMGGRTMRRDTPGGAGAVVGSYGD
ncbi:MAG TPA: stage II sporulation protein M, partial [Gemmatimonadales bacterium]